MERTALIFDAHCPYHDKQAYALALDYISNLKPRINKLVLAGDFVDFYQISFWKSDPDRLPFKDEVALINVELQDLRKRFYRIPIDYIEGNHEVRLFRYVKEKAPDLLFNNDVETLLKLRQRNIKYLSNIALICDKQKPYKIGKVNILHGHEIKISMGAINLARLWHHKTGVNIMTGHHHRVDKALVKKLDGTYDGAWCVGTLGQLEEPYSPINGWCHGFAYIDTYPDGYFEVHNKIILDNKIIEF